MFNVELNDDGVSMAQELFGVTPVMVYSHWAHYTGTCVWRSNQYSTYSLVGEPTDARYMGMFDDGLFAAGVNKRGDWDSPMHRLWTLLKEKSPESYAKRSATSDKANEWDRETMFLHGAAVTGGTAKKDANGDWSIELLKDRPRKRFLGIF